MEKENYFKRIKKKATSLEEAETFLKETRVYLVISIVALLIVQYLLQLCDDDVLTWIVIGVGSLVALVAIFFIVMLVNAMKTKKQFVVPKDEKQE